MGLKKKGGTFYVLKAEAKQHDKKLFVSQTALEEYAKQNGILKEQYTIEQLVF